MEKTRNKVVSNTKRCSELNSYEGLVYKLLLQNLIENETIDWDGNYFDLFLENGFKKLNWPKQTFVDIKVRLIYSSFSLIKKHYDLTSLNRLIIVVMEDVSIPERNQWSNVINGRNIEYISYQELKSKLSDQKEIIENSEITGFIPHVEEDNDRLLRNVLKKIKNNHLSLFLGSGVSSSAGVPSWNTLIEQLCVKKKLPKFDSDIDVVIKGRFIVDLYKDEKELNKDLRDILYGKASLQSELIKSIVRFVGLCNVESIITYNYDSLIEESIGYTKCNSVYEKKRPENGSLIPVYHVHGYVSRSEDEDSSPVVLGEREYHEIYRDSFNWGNVEQLHALNRNVCFFIGLSMRDPNLRRLLDISIEKSEVEPIHFAFFRRIEYDVPFMERTMRNFGIRCIWYDEYCELPKILDMISNALAINGK